MLLLEHLNPIVQHPMGPDLNQTSCDVQRFSSSGQMSWNLNLPNQLVKYSLPFYLQAVARSSVVLENRLCLCLPDSRLSVALHR